MPLRSLLLKPGVKWALKGRCKLNEFQTQKRARNAPFCFLDSLIQSVELVTIIVVFTLVFTFEGVAVVRARIERVTMKRILLKWPLV